MLAFPHANARPDREGFEPFHDLSTLLGFFMHLGYKVPLPRLSVFTKKHFLTIYNSLHLQHMSFQMYPMRLFIFQLQLLHYLSNLTNLIQKRIHDAFGSESESMDVHSSTGTHILDLPEDSEETVAGPTDRDDDSDADMAGPTDLDDDDNDDHGDGPSPSHGLPIIVSDIPCDPPVT